MASDPQTEEIIAVPLSGTRAQTMQRLQIGIAGLLAMVLIVGLANIILDRVKQTDASVVPDAAATVAASPTPVANAPLADAGVAPELPVTPSPAPSRPVVIDPNAFPAPAKH